MKKHSITRNITLITAVAFVIIAVFFGVVMNRRLRENTKSFYQSAQKAVINIISDGYDILDLRNLSPSVNHALTNYFGILQDEFGFDNIYIFIPDFDNELLTYVSIRTKEGKNEFSPLDGSSKKAIKEGDTINHPYSENEKKIYTEGGYQELNNSYGHTYACYAPIYSDEKHTIVSGVAGIEVSTTEVEKEQIKIFLMIYSVFVILAAGACIGINIFLRRNISDRTKKISSDMNSFTEAGLEALPDMHIEDNGHDELSDIADSFNTLSDNLRKSIAETKELETEKAITETELSLAGDIQMKMLPDRNFETENVVINAFIQPAAYIGGDFYYYGVGANGQIITAIGDVSGKGTTGAMIMSRTITIMEALVKTGYGPREAIKFINEFLTQNNPESYFVSIFIAGYDPKTQTLTYSDAGHNCPYLISSDGELTKLDSQIDMLAGLFANEEYHETKLQIKKGDRLFLYTDGVNEAESVNDGQYGYERLESLLKSNPEDLVGTLTKSLETFTEGAEQSDDITMLVMKVI